MKRTFIILLTIVFSITESVSATQINNNPDKITDSLNMRKPITQNTEILNIIGEFAVTSLIDSGLVVQSYDYIVEIDIDRSFKAMIIPLKVFAKINKSGKGKIDSITFKYENKIYKINPTFYCFRSPIELINLRKYPSYNILFKDFNFDNKPDLSVYSCASGMSNEIDDIYIFDQEKQDFYYNRTLSEGGYFRLDSIKKTIQTFWHGGGSIYTVIIYKWDNSNLIKIKEITQDYNNSIDMFIKKTTKLIDGKWISEVDTLTKEAAIEK